MMFCLNTTRVMANTVDPDQTQRSKCSLNQCLDNYKLKLKTYSSFQANLRSHVVLSDSLSVLKSI